MDIYKQIETEIAHKHGAVAEGTKKAIGDFLLNNNVNQPVNVKSNNLAKKNYSPNIISAMKLIKWLQKDGNELYFVFVDYNITTAGLEIVRDTGLIPVHNISWNCLTIESQGKELRAPLCLRAFVAMGATKTLSREEAQRTSRPFSSGV